MYECSAMLLSVLQELIACGVQRIAVVVPVAPSIQDLAAGGGGPNNGGPLPGPGPGAINAANINALPGFSPAFPLPFPCPSLATIHSIYNNPMPSPMY